MNFFTAISQITRYGANKGDNALARLKHLNDIIKYLPVSYFVQASPNTISRQKNQAEAQTKLISTLYYATFGQDVTNVLSGTKYLPFATVDAGRLGFRINSLRVNVGTEAGIDNNSWDGGDLSIYLGTDKIAEIAGDKLIALNGTAKSYLINLNTNAILLNTGTYNVDKGIVISNLNTLSVTSSATTTNFKGMISITLDTAFQQDNCGSYCPSSTCNYNKQESQLYCSLIKDACAECPTLGLSSAQIES